MQQPPQKWINAYEHLYKVTGEKMHGGSLGINSFVFDILPLWERFDGGERSEELYNEIMGVRI